jgi:uncharacterized protein YjbI with pentapeptide repeats
MTSNGNASILQNSALSESDFPGSDFSGLDFSGARIAVALTEGVGGSEDFP